LAVIGAIHLVDSSRRMSDQAVASDGVSLLPSPQIVSEQDRRARASTVPSRTAG
jgi:hypothetical protein